MTQRRTLVEEFLRRGHGLLELDVLVPGYQFYACCFCEDPDILSQWRTYANRGGGYAIGFDTEDLTCAGVKLNLSLFPADYGSGSNKELLAHDVNSLCEALTQCAKTHPEMITRCSPPRVNVSRSLSYSDYSG